MTLQAILVTETDPPPECEPISWLLLTTLKITSLEDVQQYVRWLIILFVPGMACVNSMAYY
ncbi:hypothetical protein [Nostoc sp.]|uniref:hypothetical protein n=1 Tax=Nostoc sp. TaxID=1180 RepID=UPI002FF42FCA